MQCQLLKLMKYDTIGMKKNGLWYFLQGLILTRSLIFWLYNELSGEFIFNDLKTRVLKAHKGN